MTEFDQPRAARGPGETPDSRTRGAHPPSRRRFLELAGASGLAAGLAGCAGGYQEEPDDGGDADGTDDDTGPELQDSVTIALGYEPPVTGEFWRNLYGIMPYFTNVLEPLTIPNHDLRPDPWLASDWERTGDLTWEFDLREGVTFHNGATLDAEAVVFSIQEFFDGFGNARPFLQVENAEQVRAVDDMTVEFTTVDPFADYPAHIAHNMVAVQHPDADEPENKPIGTGPFSLAEMENGQHATVEAFNDYWGEEAPAVEEITFRVIPDASTRALSLESHEIDVAYNPPRAQVRSLEEASQTAVHVRMRPSVGFCGINRYRSPTDDVRLRRALNHAVDQREIVETLLEGIGRPAHGPFSPLVHWALTDELPGYEQDFDEGRRLVEESSYAGEELSLVLSSGETEGRGISETLLNWFGEIGVDLDVQTMEWTAYWDRWESGEAHMNLATPGTLSASADYIMYGFFHSEGQWNHVMYNDEGTGLMNPGEKVDELIEEGRASMDEDTTVENYGEVQRIVMEEAGVVPLYYVEYLVGAYEDVGEFSPHPVMQMQRWASMEHRDG